MATINGTYGGSKTACEIYTHRGWYVVKGSVNVNRTYDDLQDGIDVEEIQDYDFFTADKPINSEENLINELNS